ncbi:MAG: SDR family NAD(P)-dependent oxidoreductase [Burkholderiales bacterium]|nr:SDR family NAD(P)-dependent oxidoreductase [Burkholderiales bacterium]
MKMQGNTILVAGGASGIGRGLAELLGRLGNEVIIFGAAAPAMDGVMPAHPGMQAIALDLSDPWSVAGFVEQLGATRPSLNMLVNVSIAFSVKHLPGLHALLDDDDTLQALEAQRLGIQHLTGALLPRLRNQAGGAVMNVSVGPASWPQAAPPLAPSPRDGMDDGVNACILSVRKRWASACIEVIDVSPGGERTSRMPARAAHAMPLPEFVSRVANLLAEGLQEEAATARLRALWPAPKPLARKTSVGFISEAA